MERGRGNAMQKGKEKGKKKKKMKWKMMMTMMMQMQLVSHEQKQTMSKPRRQPHKMSQRRRRVYARCCPLATRPAQRPRSASPRRRHTKSRSAAAAVTTAPPAESPPPPPATAFAFAIGIVAMNRCSSCAKSRDDSGEKKASCRTERGTVETVPPLGTTRFYPV